MTASITSSGRRDTGETSKPARFAVIGYSGYAKVLIDLIEKYSHFAITCVLDSHKPVGTVLLQYRVCGTEDDASALLSSGVCNAGVVAVGDNWARSLLARRILDNAPGLDFPTLVHPSAQIGKDVSIGVGTVILAGAVVNPGCRIGDFCILNTHSSLDHDSIMDDFSSLAPMATTGGHVKIGAYSAVCIGATVSNNINIGEHTVVGAAATVVRDIPSHLVAYGTPAREIRKRRTGQGYLGSKSRLEQPRYAPEHSSVRTSRESLNRRQRPTRLILIGCTNYAKVLIDLIEARQDYELVGLMDLDGSVPAGAERFGYRVLACENEIVAGLESSIFDAGAIAIEDNWDRSEMAARIRSRTPCFAFPALVHPSAQLGKDVLIGAGTVIEADVVVNAHAQIGEFCTLGVNSSVGHESVMGDYSSIGAKVALGSESDIGRHCVVATGGVTLDGVSVGEHTIVEPGSAVIADLPAQVVAGGVPARVLRELSVGEPYEVSSS